MAKRTTGDKAVRAVRSMRREATKGSAGYKAFVLKANKQADAMIKDFRDHVEECKPHGLTDERLIFESWAIQKIAGLQIMVFSLEKRLAGSSVRR